MNPYAAFIVGALFGAFVATEVLFHYMTRAAARRTHR